MNKIDVKEVILGSFLCLIKEPSLFIPPTIGMRLSSLSFWVSFIILSSSYAGVFIGAISRGMLSTTVILVMVFFLVSFIVGVAIQIFISAWTDSMLIDIEKERETTIGRAVYKEQFQSCGENFLRGYSLVSFQISSLPLLYCLF